VNASTRHILAYINANILRICLTLIFVSLCVYFFVGCVSQAPTEPEPARTAPLSALNTPALMSQWTLAGEVERSAAATVSAYDALSEDDARRVPANMRPLARAARLGALMVTCRVNLTLAPADEVEVSKRIAAALWAELQRQHEVLRDPESQTSREWAPRQDGVIDILTALDAGAGHAIMSLDRHDSE